MYSFTTEDESDSESADWLPAFEYVPPVNEKPRDSNTGDSGIGSTVGSTIGSTIGSTVGSTFSGSAFFSKLGSIFKVSLLMLKFTPEYLIARVNTYSIAIPPRKYTPLFLHIILRSEWGGGLFQNNM